MSLYQSHRPATLDEVIGNDATVEGLRAHFAQEPTRVSHAHIIYGDSGCGKTTLARAVARSILGATDMTIHEINTADNRGIDTIREIIEQLKYPPIGGKSVVYIIDEAHGLSTDAKRALLKPLEDCPKRVFFFLCTTNLKQLLKGDEGKAINTRCTQWEVAPLTPRQVVKLVKGVAAAENYEVDQELLEAIVAAADGSPRAALVALEKVMPITDREQQLAVLKGGLEEDPDTRELCQAILKRAPWGTIAGILAKLKNTQDPETIRRAVTGYMTAVLLKKFDPTAALALEAFSENTYDNGFPAIVLASLRSQPGGH